MAPTVVFAEITNVQTGFELPAHAPAQLLNMAPAFGTAVNVIEVPEAKLVPAGDCIIVPGPETFVASVTGAPPVKVAVTAVFVFRVSKQSSGALDGTVHAPAGVQPLNVAPVFGTGVNTTVVPGVNEFPGMDWVIVPGPTTVVVSVTFATNCATTLVFWVTTKVQGTRPTFAGQPPPQFTNEAFALGLAVR